MDLDDDGHDEWLDDILGRTAALFASRGEQRIVALLLDVESIAIVPSNEVIGTTENVWTNELEPVYSRVVMLDVEDHLVERFTPEVLDAIAEVFGYVASRQGQDNVRFAQARPVVRRIDGSWRDVLSASLDGAVSNQARHERGHDSKPVADDLTFGSAEELRLYESLKRFQRRASEDDTIAIVPSAGVRLRAGHTWTPDFVVIGRGRAVVFEVDGPHHRRVKRFADDKNRDLQWLRCGIQTVRLTVEDMKDDEELDGRVREELRRHVAK